MAIRAPGGANKLMQTSCLSGFLICGYQNFCSLPTKLGCMAQKRPFLPQNMRSLAHISLVGTFGALLVGLLVGCGAWAVSRKTPIYFMLSLMA